MNLITAIQLATIPAMLIIVASVLVQRHNLEEISTGRRWFFWLLGLSVGIQLFVFLSQLLSLQNGIQLGYFLAVASLPILLGMLALLVLDAGVWIGGLFAVLLPLVLFGAFQLGYGTDYQALTAQRAARIQAALEHYKTKNEVYPVDLQGLVPGELIAVPQPVIYPGEGWCYQSGPDFYQLSTYYRRYFSTPFSLRVYAAAGNPPGLDAACQNHLVELKRMYDPIAYPGP